MSKNVCTAKQALKVAKKWISYAEKRTNGNLKSKTANAGSANYTYFGLVMHNAYPLTMDFPAPWCDAFVDYCIYEACKRDMDATKHVLCGAPDDYTVHSANYYKAAGRFGDAPEVGAQIFFTRDATYSGICHTGFVAKVTASHVHTIEGNTSGCPALVTNGGAVCEKTYRIGDTRIAGYGYPRYKLKKKAAKREDARAAAKSYVVTASELNVRTKRSTKSSEIVARVKKGTVLKLCNLKRNSAGNTWAEIASGKYAGRFIAVEFKKHSYARLI